MTNVADVALGAILGLCGVFTLSLSYYFLLRWSGEDWYDDENPSKESDPLPIRKEGE